MTSEIDPLPSTRGPHSPAPKPSVEVSDMPEDTPRDPAPEPTLDVAPFGEVDTPPPAREPTAIPAMATDESSSPKREYTDADLAEALRPLMGGGSIVPAPFASDDFEATLRCAIRRAMAEHTQSPFDRPDFVHRCMWRFDALLSSRSYEEILYEKTRRFRIEEIYLYDHDRLSLLSFASADPSRHTSARKINPAAQRIASRIRDSSGAITLDFTAGDGRRAIVRLGRWSILVALVHGQPDALVRNDLDYAQRRIEQRFQKEFDSGSPLLLEIQPLLEECLLIHSPVIPVEF